MKKLILIAILSPFLSYSADTLAVYKMGEIEIIKGLSYGCRYTLTLFKDSTYNYSAESAGQISIHHGMVSKGNWTLKKDTLILEEKKETTREFYLGSSGYRKERKNIVLWFHIGSCIQSFDMPPLIVYGKDKTIKAQLNITPYPWTEIQKQLKYPVHSLSATLELDLPAVDSISMFGITTVPKLPEDNEINLTIHAPFKVKLVMKDNELRVLDHRSEPLYVFKKTSFFDFDDDNALQKELLQILEDDQDIRTQYTEAAKKLGYKHPTLDSLGKLMRYKDSINVIKVTRVLDERGWLGKDKIGNEANMALFLVIQHADLKVQEKYLPMMRDAVKKGNAKGTSLALLEDRVALRTGKKQIYGSQIYINLKTNEHYIAPLEDPDNVDKRRAEVGLPPLADYVSYWEIKWDPAEYKKRLPEYEKLWKETLKK
jgi:hypothetical protein